MVHDNYSYLIVGGGMAADAAVHGIREVDADGTIGLLSAEPDPPYKRPPLSKKLWRGKPLDSVWLGTDQLGVDLHLGRTGRLLDLQHNRVVDDRGTEYGFDKLLLATGVTPRRLPVGGHWITYYRTLKDYQRLRQEAARGQRFAVIGGGFIGSEIAAALAMNGKEVVMILPEAGIGSRLFPTDLAVFLNDYYREHGVEVLTHSMVTDVVRRGDRFTVETRDKAASTTSEFQVDGIVAGIGARPNIELAQTAGLAINDGIVVDPYLRTSHPDVYAAGDIALYWQSVLGNAAASNMKTTPRRWVASRDERWLASRRRTSTSPFSTPTCSIWATRRLVTSMPGSRWWPSGRSRTARVSSRTAARAGCGERSSGTSGISSMRPGR